MDKFPVETTMVVKGEDEFLCHVYIANSEYYAFVDLVSERGRSWENGKGSTPDKAIYNAIEKIYKIIDQ